MDLGKLSVTLGAQMAEFNRNMDAAKDRLEGVDGEMKKATESSGFMRLKMVAAAGAVAAALIAMTRSALSAGTQLQNLSRMAGVGAGEFSELAYAGRSVGVSTEQMADALRTMGTGLSQAETGSVRHRRALAALGIELQNIQRMGAPEQFELIAQRISQLENPADRARAATDLLGGAGAKLLPLMEQGARGIRAAREEAVRLGAAVSDEQVKKLADADAAIQKMKESWSGFSRTLISSVAPALETVFNKLAGISQQSTEARMVQLREMMRMSASYTDFYKKAAAELTLLENRASWGGSAGGSTRGRYRGGDTSAAGTAAGYAAAEAAAKAEEDRVRAAEKAAIEIEALNASLYDMQYRLHQDLVEDFIDGNARMVEAEIQGVTDRLTAQVEGYQTISDAVEDYQQRTMESLRLAMASEADLERERYAEQLEQLAHLEEAKIEALGGYYAVKEALEEEHQKRLQEIRERGMTDMERFQAMSWDRQVATVAGSLSQMTAGVASSNKKMFELNKAAAIANAVISAYEGINKTMAAYPYPLSVGMAAAQAAAAFANVAAIKNAQFGSGLAPSQAGTAAKPVASPTQSRVVTVSGLAPGSLFTGRQIAELLQEAIDDGTRLVLN